MSNNALTRRVLLASSAALAVAGCADVVGPPPAPKLYLLHPTMPGHSDAAKLSGVLAIAMPKADAGFDTDRIAIEQPGAILDYYADAAWPDHLPVLLQNALVEAFESSGAIDTVTDDTGGLRTNYVLMTSIRDFESRYSVMDGVPTAVVRLDVHLVDPQDRSEVGHFVSAANTPATVNSVAAAVAALNSALSDVLSDIVRTTVSKAARQ